MSDHIIPEETLRFRSAFISFAGEDKQLALELVRKLEEKGCKCWISARDILPGSNWDFEIMQGLKKSEVVILLLTEYANQSKYVEMEVYHASTANKLIVPVRFGAVAFSERLAFWLAAANLIEATPGLEGLDSLLPQILRGIQPTEISNPPVPQTLLRAPIVRSPRKWLAPILMAALLAAVAWPIGSRLFKPAPELSEDKEQNRAGPVKPAPSDVENNLATPDAKTPPAEPGPTFTNSLGMKFVPVPGVKALFCIHNTRVDDWAAFAKDAQYTALLAKHGRQPSGEWKNPFAKATPSPHQQGGNEPVVCVSWQDALAFCEWLTLKEGRVHRLPTDSEWSWAVGLREEKGTAPDEKGKDIAPTTYPWGNHFPPKQEDGNHAGPECGSATKDDVLPNDGYAFTSPFNAFKANPFGLYDMGGNVVQLCPLKDSGLDNESLNASDPKAFCKLRGSAWETNTEKALRSSCRWDNHNVYASNLIGFRCVVEEARLPMDARTEPKARLMLSDGTTKLQGSTLAARRIGDSMDSEGNPLYNGAGADFYIHSADDALVPGTIELQYTAHVAGALPSPGTERQVVVDGTTISRVYPPAGAWKPVFALPAGFAHTHCSNFGTAVLPAKSKIWAGAQLFVGKKGMIPAGSIPVHMIYRSQVNGENRVMAEADFTLDVPFVPWALDVKDTKLNLLDSEAKASLSAAPVTATRGPTDNLLPGSTDHYYAMISYCPTGGDENVIGPVAFRCYALHTRLKGEPAMDGKEIVLDPAKNFKRVRLPQGEFFEFSTREDWMVEGQVFEKKTTHRPTQMWLDVGPAGELPEGEHEFGITLDRAGEIIHRSQIKVKVGSEFSIGPK